MKGAQLKKLIDEAGLSQRDAAAAIELSERQLYYYLSSETVTPLKVEYALRWVAHLANEAKAKQHAADCACMDCRRKRKQS